MQRQVAKPIVGESGHLPTHLNHLSVNRNLRSCHHPLRMKRHISGVVYTLLFLLPTSTYFHCLPLSPKTRSHHMQHHYII